MFQRLFLRPRVATIYYDYERDLNYPERADRARLAQFEREARERIAMLEGQLAESTAHTRTLSHQLDVAAAKLARLDATFLGRLARRSARDGP